MAMVSNFVCAFFPSQVRRPTRSYTKWHNLTVRSLLHSKIRAASTVASETTTEPMMNGKVRNGMNVLACPICYDQLVWRSAPDSMGPSTSGSSFECHTCKKAYDNGEAYIDLTVTTGSKEYNESVPPATELFRSPLVSFLYERGWRQSFIWGGFPGQEKEFEMARGYLQPSIGGTIVDASCGSGLFSRMFAKSRMFSLVVALDFSEEMLQQCYEFANQDASAKENLILVRADISRLPFVPSSVDAVHAGAALHCWPSPSSAVAEISRILKPGGVFVATTFILDGVFSILPITRIVRWNVARFSGNQFFLSEAELKDLCNACGLEGFTCVRNGRFVMISATKPS